jgi:ribulose-bisphosphate carboxylase large chain
LNYLDFMHPSYKPEEDLICDFNLSSEEMDFRTAAGGVAAESSIGTWTELGTLKPYMEKLGAKVFEIQGNNIRIAYPLQLFEPGNMPNILSSVAGNVFGLKGIDLRLTDIHFPNSILQSFQGPKYGIDGVRRVLQVSDRPLVGTIIKPKLGLKTSDHAEVGYNAWVGGCDIVKDDENLSSQEFNPFEQRLAKTLEARDRAESETGEKKGYLINVTAETQEMLRRTEMVESSGGRYVMVDVITAGFSALQTLRNQNFKLIIHAHRAGHAAFTKSQIHGISMTVIAKVSRIIGVDQLHVGTAVGKMSEGRGEVEKNVNALCEGLEGFKSVFPVASGGLHPAHVPALFDIFGRDFICQAGGGIHGHPKGTKQGATAMRQAVDASMKGLSLVEYANEHRELALALETWGEV